jgi:hypothetical protein
MEKEVLSSPFSSEGLRTASARERGFRDVHDLSPEVLDEHYGDYAATEIQKRSLAASLLSRSSIGLGMQKNTSRSVCDVSTTRPGAKAELLAVLSSRCNRIAARRSCYRRAAPLALSLEHYSCRAVELQKLSGYPRRFAFT